MDKALIYRVRTRKLSEISHLAQHAIENQDDSDMYVDLIVALADDIDACGILLDTGGEATIELDPIDSPEYLDSLTGLDRKDEDAFNALKTAPSEAKDDDAMETMKEELRLCRERIETLSQQLDYARGETASVEEILEEVKKENNALDRRNAELRSEIAGLQADRMIDTAKLSVLNPDPPKQEGADAPVGDISRLQGTADGGEGSYLSESTLNSLRDVRSMKAAKITQLESLASTGNLEPEVAEGIIDFLKVDVSVCDAILGIDFKDHNSVVSGFRKVVDILRNSGEPKYQDVYGNLLTPDESVYEFNFMQILNSMQGMMMYLKDEIGM